MATSSSPQKFWMDSAELRDSPTQAFARTDEFAPDAAAWPEGLSRRRFLQLASATTALAGLSGCMRLPQQKIVPYTEQPEKLIPGQPLHFATTLQINGHPRGVVVTQHEGRPTHIAGNPLHPMSLGAADVWTTASLIDLYDPERLQNPLRFGELAAWSTFVDQVMSLHERWTKNGGAGLCLLSALLSSPTEARLQRALLARFPQAKLYVYDPILAPEGHAAVEPVNLANADVIFSLENNFLYDRPDSLALTRAFVRRRQSGDGSAWNRLYVAESHPTVTGATADHRFAVPPQDFDALAEAVRQAVQGTPPKDPRWPWLGAVIDDLRQKAGRCLLLAGRAVSETARQAIFEANQALGNVGQTLSVSATASEIIPGGTLADLAGRMEKGEVSALVMLGGNPVYDAPSDIPFGTLLGRVETTIYHTLYANETSSRSGWTIPATHDLEAWGDARALDGTLSLTQPLIAPLYESRSRLELLAFLSDGLEPSGYDLVRTTWQALAPLAAPEFEAEWHHWLRNGVVQLPAARTPASEAAAPAPTPIPSVSTSAADVIWLNFCPDDCVWDGRHANNGWLQELPDPLTKLTWDNAVWLSPATAFRLSAHDGDILILQTDKARLEAPALIVPGHADRCVTLALGYGRSVAGSTGKDVGANAYTLRRSDAWWHVPLSDIEVSQRRRELARTQQHFRVEGRDLLHVAPVDRSPPVAPAVLPPPSPSLYPEIREEGHRWALTIDLNACTGCNACIIACQSENNIPIVGRDQVLRSREMQWIRVDRYYEGPEENPRLHFQPVTCMQCEDAPCEVVCPVAATQHDDEGLNAMIYNRCVGTRYCSNNCPYKVRRFNFLFYNADIPASQQLRLNPNVTVRSRGVMEKCTYCVQRIEEARLASRRERRELKDGDIITSCQAACPAEAIIFGDLSDSQSAVSRSRQHPGNYAMLEELNTRPRTTYLEKRINLNPALQAPGSDTSST